MNKIVASIMLTSTLLLTGCQAYPDIESIIRYSEPTYVNVEKINENSQIFIDKEEPYVLTDSQGLTEDNKIHVEDQNIVFVILETSKEDEQAYVFVGIKKGSTKAYIEHPDGSKTNFIINVG